MTFPSIDDDLAAHLKILYASYRHTVDIDAKGAFFSPSCYQICRPNPSFAATTRGTIVRYLHEHAAKNNPTAPKKRGFYTIRPLRDAEYEFGTDEQVVPAGFSSALEVRSKAIKEGWVGMRVDLWDERSEDEANNADDLMVKVQYWWRKEDGVWTQIFHDIVYIGPRDGTEGIDGEILE